VTPCRLFGAQRWRWYDFPKHWHLLYKSTQCHNPEEQCCHLHCCENLRSQKVLMLFFWKRGQQMTYNLPIQGQKLTRTYTNIFLDERALIYWKKVILHVFFRMLPLNTYQLYKEDATGKETGITENT
jgi:hypothetical protein